MTQNVEPEVESFRILVVEDEEEALPHIVDQFKADDDIHLIIAKTQAEALQAIDTYVLDAAIVDIELDVPAGGLDVLRKFSVSNPNLPLIIYTRYLDPAHVRDLTNLISDEPPRITAIIDKGPLSGPNFHPKRLRMALADEIDGWRQRRVSLANRELAVALLASREKRVPGYRRNNREVEAELDRICSRLFGDINGLADGSQIGVVLDTLGPEGLSAAITVEARVTLGNDARGEPVTGSRCVLKIGPVSDIREEVERYAHFVKYGVRLAQRVELLGATYQQSLGAVCYSFAGGVFGKELLSLSKLLESPADRALAKESIAFLFALSSQNWYAVQCDQESARNYVAKTYRTDFGACYRRLDAGLTALQGKFRDAEVQKIGGGYLAYRPAGEEVDGSLELGSRKLLIPHMNMLGEGRFVAAIPSCLVHGDMHGDNVMLELDEASGEERSGEHGRLRRICLIDYRSAGPGPRATDAIALQASLRLVDAKEIMHEVAGHADVSELSDVQVAEAACLAAKREDAEMKLLKHVGSDGRPAPEVGGRAQWEEMDIDITAAVRDNFDDLARSEYLVTSLPLVLRYFGLSLGPVARVRMLAWVSAQLRALRSARPKSKGGTARASG